MFQLPPLDLLRQARVRYSQGELATLLDVDVRTVRRWEVRENAPPPIWPMSFDSGYCP